MPRGGSLDRWMRTVVLVVAGLSLARAARTDPPGAPAPPAPAPSDPAAAAAARAKLSLLKDRVAEWCRARQEMKGDCGNCGGSGTVRVGRFLKQCSTCLGAGKAISKARFTQVFYDMVSPAWRKLDSAKPAAEALWAAARKEVRTYRNLGSYRIDTMRLVGERFAYVTTFENGEGVPRESRWVHATEPSSRKTTWFFWREEADGPWPDPATAPGSAPAAAQLPGGALAPGGSSAPGAAPSPAPEPASAPDPIPRAIDEKLRVAVVAALARAKIVHTIDKVGGDEANVVVTLIRGRPLSRLQWKTAVDPDVIAAARATFSVASVKGVRVLLTVPAKNAFGAIEARPRATYDMGRETYSKIDFANLTTAEAIRLFAIDRLAIGEWTVVEEDPAPDSLTLEQDKSVATALATAKLVHKIRALGRYADVLVVRLALADAADEDASELAAGPASVKAALALLPALPEWNGVRLEYALPYRDSFGKVEERVHYVMYLSRERYAKLKLDNLTDAEVVTHFEIDRPVLTGLAYWPK